MRLVASIYTCVFFSLPALAGVPLTELSYDATVVGPLAEVTVHQVFTNDSDTALDAIYVFPLHENAVVDAMEMRIGDRVITGEIEERSEAEARYRDALAQGQTAALTSQERPNVFQQQVGNIEAGAEIEVVLSVVQPVPRIDGSYELVVPLSIAPRFVPQGTPGIDWFDGTGPAVVPRVTVRGNPGFEVATLKSVNHRNAELSHDALGIGASVAADPSRDFLLRWTYAFDEPQVALLHDGEHLLLLVEPPSLPPEPEKRVPRELVWVLDTSCSMRGMPWERSRATLLAALDDLDARDTFQLVAFDNDAHSLFTEPVTANTSNVDEARVWVTQMQPGGGTNMFHGIREALNVPMPPGRQRVVTFLSDGLIGNEITTLQTLERYRGPTRVHSIAVGDTPNRYMMEQLAHLGGGRFLAAPLRADPMKTAQKLMAVMERPVLAGVELEWGALDPTDVQPAKMPLLYPGQPTTLVARFEGEPDAVRLAGNLGDEHWELTIDPQLVPQGRAVASTWARQQIQALQDRAIREPGFDPRPDGLEVAMAYEVLSPWTSFIAIDPASDVLHGPDPEPESGVPLSRPKWGRSGGPVTGEFLARVPTGRTYQQATSMAAGIGVGVTAGGNPNIGGAATNENVYIVDGSAITDPVTGTFSTNFSAGAASGEALVPGRLEPQPLAPLQNNLHVRVDLNGTAGSGPGGGLEVEVAGPVVRDHLSAETLVSIDEHRTTTDRDGEALQMGRQHATLTAAADLGPRSHASSRVHFTRSRVASSERLERRTLGGELHHLTWLTNRLRLDTEARLEQADSQLDGVHDRTWSGGLQSTLQLELPKHTLSARLGVSGLDRNGLIESTALVDRYRLGLDTAKLRQGRGAVVLEHVVLFSPRWKLASSVEGNLTHVDAWRGFVGGRIALAGQPLDGVELNATASRLALPLLAAIGPAERRQMGADASIHLFGPWQIQGDVALQQLLLQGVSTGQASGSLTLERSLRRRWTARLGYRVTQGFGRHRDMLVGAKGLRFVEPPHQLHAGASWTLPTDPFPLELSAAFDTDFSGWNDLTVGASQKLPLPRGSLVVGVRGANLLGSDAERVLDDRDPRFLVVGRQPGRRLEVDVGWHF